MVEVREHSSMFVGFDDRYLPLIITTFRGAIDLTSAQWHDEVSTKVIHAAIARKQHVLLITDARGLEVPSAVVRRFWASRLKESTSILDAMLGTFVVIDNPLLRAASKAIDWLTNEPRRVEYFNSLAQAFSLANSRFAAAGYPTIDIDAETYACPRSSLSGPAR